MRVIAHETKITIAFALVLLGGMFYLGMKVQKIEEIDDIKDRLVRIENLILEGKSLTKR